MSSIETFPLTVQVTADEWAFAQRRLTYLEALLLRLVREKKNIQEWYRASELAAMRLPGLPDTADGVVRKATAGRWPRKDISVKGRKVGVYHVASLPNRAFDALIGRVLDVPELGGAPRPVPNLPPVEAPPPPVAPNTAPAWVLPLIRLIKGKAEGDLARAWEELPNNVPFGTVLPTAEQAVMVLMDLGLMEKYGR
ncbi:DNA-binding protein [Rhizobiales bacterium 3FA27D7]|jgi:hypothetical protein|uniref:DNA-binding protein n=1 Tax=Mesorhizobium sp. 2RAF21 TaxID=3232995 RepID=UPI0010F9BD43